MKADFSPAERTGQLLITGFEGTSLNDEIRDLILKRHIGGVILFERNHETPEQLWRLIRDMQALSVFRKNGLPLFISVDQEGGRVSRLKAPFSEFPFQYCLGNARSEELAFRFGQGLASELKSVGINMDYAPVLDVNTNPNNPIIGERAICFDPGWTARLGAEVIRGFEQTGVIPVGKHFPGHGDTLLDSHLELPTVEKEETVLRKEELHPFDLTLKKGLKVIMTAHVIYPAWDKTCPATFSSQILRGLLRDQMNYKGLIMSDDLEMKAIQDHMGVDDLAELGLEAGLDIFLVCHNVDKIKLLQEKMIQAAEKNNSIAEKIETAFQRILQLKNQSSLNPPSTPPDFNHWSKIHEPLIQELKEYL